MKTKIFTKAAVLAENNNYDVLFTSNQLFYHKQINYNQITKSLMRDT